MDKRRKMARPSLKRIDKIVARYQDKRWPLIPLLQEIQQEVGYIPPEAINPIARAFGLFPSQVQGVITFYASFSLKPKGKYVLRVCRGTACHVRGGKSILRLMKQELGLDEGETSEDYQFTFETTACLGACALAPTMMVNDLPYGKLTPPKLSGILTEYGKSKEES